MAKQYLVTNPSSAPICIVGRRRIEIPAQCVNHPCFFSGEEEAKTVITRFKRRYPLLKFEPVEDSENAVQENPENTAPPEIASEQVAVLMDADTFANSATVERSGSGWCTVTVAGLTDPLKVRLSGNEPTENAVPRAFEQYVNEHKE